MKKYNEKKNESEVLTRRAGEAYRGGWKNGGKGFWRRHWFWFLGIFPLLCFGFLQLCRQDSSYAESYARNVFPYVTYVPRLLNTFIPFSVAEICVVVGGPLLLIAIIAGIIRLIVKKGRLAFLGKTGKAVYIVFCVMYTLFYLNFGFCYERKPLEQNLGLHPQARSTEDLRKVTEWAMLHVNELADKVGRDDKGLFKPAMTQDQIMSLSADAYKRRSEISEIPFVKEHMYLGPVRTKPVMLSYYWSYTGIAGIYVPFLTESSVNVAVRPDEKIFTAMHEVAHSFGFAREDEANFLAFYNGVLHDNPEVRYGCWLMGFTYLNNALYGRDAKLQGEIYARLSDKAKADLNARDAFWKQFEGPVQEVSNKVNDAYLKANKVEDGVKSYGRVTDLILAYYQSVIGGLAS